MRTLLSLVTAIAVFVSVGPAFGATTMSKSTTIVKGGPCNGHVVRVNTDTKTYVVAGKMTSVKTKTTTVMCESAAKAKGYRMMTRSMTVITKKKTMTKSKTMTKTPAVNPSGVLNADKGASPNPMNNANGVHTTNPPNPSPTP